MRISLSFRALFVLAALAAAPSAYATYNYDYTVSTFSIGTLNGGGITTTSLPYGYQTYTAGSLILTPAISTGSDYEVYSQISLKAAGGTFIHYLRASSNALASSGACAGSYISVEAAVSSGYTGGPASATITVRQCTSGSLSSLGGTTVTLQDGMTLRSVANGGALMVYLNNVVVLWIAIPTTSGQPGIGGYGMSSSSFYPVKFGHLDTTVPLTVSGTTVHSSVLENQIALKWQGAADDTSGTDGIGVYGYLISRGGTPIGFANAAEYFDNASLSAGMTYTYTISAMDYHGNTGAATSVSVTTAPTGSVDPRRAGVRSTGSYWGGGGEQIDTLSGNLNFSIPLLAAQGRTGWSAPVGLSYNSQNWRQDGSANWQLGSDNGFGYAWKAQFGSITPYYGNLYGGILYYIFTDSTGAEYKLDQFDTNGVWFSQQGLYVWFDAATRRLYFKNGMFWFMGCISGGDEPDAGTMYPTVIEDTGGNQVIVTYMASASMPSDAHNTSGMIYTVEDARAAGSLSYLFGYSTFSVSPARPHLAYIQNYIGTQETYSFSYNTSAGLMPPFGTDATYSGMTTWQLGCVTHTATSHACSSSPVPADSWTFAYDTAGASELLKAQFPTGGYIRWTYSTQGYAGSRSLREIADRYIYSGATSGGSEDGPYPFTHSDSGTSIATVHADTTLVDASGNGAKKWSFITSTTSPWKTGLVSQFDQKTNATGSVITSDAYTWAQTATTGNPYISQKDATKDPGTGSAVTMKTTQTVDLYGNTTNSAVFPFVTSSTPLMAYVMTYSSASGYVDNYVRGLLTGATVSVNGATATTLVTNSYDSCVLAAGTSTPPAYEYDAATRSTYYGYLTSTTSLAGTSSACVQWYGAPYSATAPDGTTTTTTITSATSYTLPDSIATPTYSEAFTYNAALQSTQVQGYNGETMYTSYDADGRPATATSPYGTYGTPTVTYSYSNRGVLPMTQSTSGPGGLTITTLDGFGRPVNVVRKDGSTVVSTVDSVYAPCACSPLGKLKKTSQPYVSGTVYWTEFTYDAIGRTVAATAPDTLSVTGYSYAGNTTTITDPAGKVKKFTMDEFGNLSTVLEDPSGLAYSTSYTYDWQNHLTGTSMTRGGTTQTRTFAYNTAGQMTSATNPESGTVTYTYNTDHTLQKKHDANGADTVYSYDSAKRVTLVQRYPLGVNSPYGTGSPANEDQCQRAAYTYDAGTNGYGRLTSTLYGSPYSWAGITTCSGTGLARGFNEDYTYDAAGGVTGKTLTVVVPASPPYTTSVSKTASYTYDSAGRAATYTYDGVTYTYSYDSMGRPLSLTDDLTYNAYGSFWATPGTTWAKNAQYDAAGRMTSLDTFESAVPGTEYYRTETKTFNTNGQLTSLDWVSSGSSIHKTLTYGYYAGSPAPTNGQITQVTDHLSGETVAYTYDALKRLETATATPVSGSTPTAWSQHFLYDGFGNLTSKDNGTTTIGVTAATNRLSGGSYDNNGNMTSGAGLTMTYDVANRLVSATPPSVGTEYYMYAPDNRKVYTKKANGDEEIVFYGGHGENVGSFSLVDLSGVGTGWVLGTLRKNIWFAGKQLAEGLPPGGSGTAGQLLQDRTGNNRSNGERYAPYGEELGTLTGQDHLKFGTYTRNGYTGLDYADQRYYEAGNARFNTVDRGPSDAGSPQSFNRYSYTAGDPVNRNDPSGLCSQDEYGHWWDDAYMATSYTTQFDGGACQDNQSWLENVASFGVIYNDRTFVYTVPPGPDECYRAENAAGCTVQESTDGTDDDAASSNSGIPKAPKPIKLKQNIPKARKLLSTFTATKGSICDKDLLAVGLTINDIRSYAMGGLKFQSASGDTLDIMNAHVADFLVYNQLPIIYYNQTYAWQTNISQLAATLIHEFSHVAGQNDRQDMTYLGISGNDTREISKKLAADCF